MATTSQSTVGITKRLMIFLGLRKDKKKAPTLFEGVSAKEVGGDEMSQVYFLDESTGLEITYQAPLLFPLSHL